MRLSEYASTRKTRGSYKMPRSVQQSIPIDRIYADGVWQSENVFSMMWQISDINYAMQSDAAKQNILTQLGTVYAGIPADCWMQVCIVSQRMDEKAFARDVLYHRENDGFDALRAERNRQIKANARENGNVVQHKYIIVSTNKPGVKEARERFVQVQGHLLSAFSALECAVTPLDNRARLEVLHKFFRIFEEGRFNFDFDNCANLGQDFRDSIASDCIRFCKKHIEIEDFYAKCMTISEYPQQLDDKFISALLQQVPYIVLSIDIEPVETEDKPLMESHYTAPCPTIKDLWMALNNQRDKRSKEIALALRIFATGSMQAFAQPTNVDMSNRLICFNIQSLGEQLKPVAMLSMLEYINTAVMSNERNDPKAATWVYFDEIYLLLRDSLSANFLYTSWKRFRKYNAYATGITQNVQDCLTNDTAYAMLANSEFVVMLRQTKDIDSVVELYGLSEPQRKYLLLAQPGEGIIKMGNSLIPFNNPQPKDTKTYKLLTTKPGEME